MKRALLACLILLPGCNQPDPSDDGADDVETSGTESETGDDDTTTEDGDGDASTTDTTGDGDTTTTDTTGDGDTTDTTGDGDTTTDTTDTTGDGDTTDTTDDGEEDDDTTTTTTGDGDGGDNCPPMGGCNDIIAAFESEAMAIRGCSDDAQCGQVLQGTSCGCTRDWVARVDADTTCFYDLIDQAQILECDLGLFSTCDCPGTDGFACVQGICTWDYL